MRAYLDLVRQVIDHGERKSDRTGTGTRSLFGLQARYDLRDGFPLVTTKKVLFDSVVRELLWFIRGATNIRDGLDTGIWDAWADPNGGLGPIYGHQWRRWGATDGNPGVDQLADAIRTIKETPDSRRIIVSAWNVADIPLMALPPCHAFFQFYVSAGHLDCQLYQRSADLALGVPFNIASYALLLAMIAQECELTPRFLVHTLGDAHVYENHVDGLMRQLEREPLPLPRVAITPKPVFDVRFEDVRLEGYRHHPFIKFKVAV